MAAEHSTSGGAEAASAVAVAAAPASAVAVAAAPASAVAVAAAPASARKTAYVWHERYFWHDSGLESSVLSFEPRGSQESPETKRRIHSLFNVTTLPDVLVPVKPRKATDEEILRFHTPEYLARVKEISALPIGGQVGHELHIGHGGFDIASLSLGGVLAAVEAVFAGAADNAFALVRPPGHHAERDSGHGFCLFSNVSLAADHAIKTLGAKRVAIIDWDVHHGNGSEQHMWERDDVLFVSLHQDRLYPIGTGQVDAVGAGAGRGYNLNIPLPPGCGNGAYQYAFEAVVLPALHAFKPDLILVSSGLDCGFLDPLGRMMVTSEGFRWMTRAVRKAAETLCGGRLVISHEGGYSAVTVPYFALAIVEELSGHRTGVVDPFLDDVGSPEWQAVQPHQRAAIDRAAENLKLALIK